MSDVPGKQGLYGLSGDAEVQGAKTLQFASAQLWFAALMAAAGFPYSVSALLSGHTPLYLGVSLLALALACFAVWLSWRVWKDPALRTPNPFALLLFPAIGSAALSRMIRTLERGGALGIFDVIEVGGLIVGLLPLCLHPSGCRRLLKGGA